MTTFRFEIMNCQIIDNHPVPGTEILTIHVLVDHEIKGNIFDGNISVTSNAYGVFPDKTKIISMVSDTVIRNAIITKLDQFLRDQSP